MQLKKRSLPSQQGVCLAPRPCLCEYLCLSARSAPHSVAAWARRPPPNRTPREFATATAPPHDPLLARAGEVDKDQHNKACSPAPTLSHS